MIVENLAEILPFPKFKIGELVKYSYTYNDPLDKEYYEQKIARSGVILGISLGLSDCRETTIHSGCWAYLVYIESESQPHFKPCPNYLESFCESELEKCS